MTEQRVCANGEDLFQYIQGCQDMAAEISSLIESAAVIDNDGTYPNGVTALLKVSGTMAQSLENKLDSTSLPKVTS